MDLTMLDPAGLASVQTVITKLRTKLALRARVENALIVGLHCSVRKQGATYIQL